MKKSISSGIDCQKRINMRWIFCILTLLLFQSSMLFAASNSERVSQNDAKILKGKVVDEKGQALPSVSIVIKGTTTGTLSDVNGNYSLQIPDGNVTLVYAYLGFISQEIVPDNKTSINITLKEDRKALDEVVVVSYGTQKKRDVTGAVAKVNGSSLGDIPLGQMGQKLQGQVAGVQVSQYSGQPGQGLNIRIRGAASVNGGSGPLFVVDGLPISSDQNSISPDQIETYSVLKDAAATALYGSRAANGVILITTKRGKAGKTSVEFNASYGVQTLSGLKKPDIMNAHEFATYMKGYYEDKIKYEGYKDPIPASFQNPDAYGVGTNWYDEVTRSAPIQDYSLSVTSGSDKFRSAMFLDYFNQDGIMLGTGFQRASLRANMDYQINPRIKLGLNIAPTFTVGNNQGTDGNRSALGGAMDTSPLWGPYDENGNLRYAIPKDGAMFPRANWVRKLNETVDVNKTFTTLMNFTADVDIWNGIKYKFQAGAGVASNNHRQFHPSTSAGDWATPSPSPADTWGQYDAGFNYNWSLDNMLTYTKRINKHQIDALVGYSAQESSWEGSGVNGNWGTFPNDAVPWMDASTDKSQSGNSANDWAMASTLGRINYSYNDRYLFQATVRRDGCSRFGANNRFAIFPSVSAGWVVTDESFMKKVTPVMNFFKLRASYGQTGNYNIGNYAYIASLKDDNYTFGNTLVPGKSLNGIGNNDLTWEKTGQFDVGFDVGFLDNRIYVVYDYYSKKTNSMLNDMQIPSSSGFTSVTSNLGGYNSWGHEISITSRNIDHQDFKWTTNFNIAFNRNEITDLGGVDFIGSNTDGQGQTFSRLMVGQPLGVFYGYVFDGIYTQAEIADPSVAKHKTSNVGTVKYKDINGPDGKPDGMIDSYDKQPIGNPNPNAIYGLNNTFSYKRFDLGIMFTGQFGGQILNANNEDLQNLDGIFNVQKEMVNRWRSPEDPGNGLVPRTLTKTTELYRFANTTWVHSATYFSINNVTLGYSLPIKSNDYIKKARLSFTVQNLAMFCDKNVINPQISTGANNPKSGMGLSSWDGLGVDRCSYPVPRIFTVACNITF